MANTTSLTERGIVRFGASRLAVDYELDVFRHASTISIIGHIFARAESLEALKFAGSATLTLSNGKDLLIEVSRHPIGSGSCIFKGQS